MGNNEPREFILTPDNVLETLMTWMPDQMDRMRQYEVGAIKVDDGFASLECQYMQTVGGEKFRIVDRTPMGDSGSDYYAALGSDEDVILAFARRIEGKFSSLRRKNAVLKAEHPIEFKMTFSAGPFESVEAVAS